MSKNNSSFKRVAVFHNLPGGGSVQVMNEVVNHLKKRYLIDIYTCGELTDRKKRKIFTHNQLVYKVRPWVGFILRNLWIYLILPEIHKRIARDIDQEKYEFVIVNHDYFTKSPYILRYLKSKTIYYLHEPPREFYESSAIHAPLFRNKLANIFRIPIKYIDKKNVEKATEIIANSKYSKRVIWNIYNRKSNVIYPGVNTDRYSPSDRVQKLNRILMIGSLNKIKGHDFVLRSIKQMLKIVEVIIVGEGDILRFAKTAKENGINLNRLTYINDLNEKQMVALYRSSLVTCAGSYLEPFGLTSLESQSCGTPVVAVNEGGYVETIVNGVSGYLSNRNEIEFASKIALAIKNNGRLSFGARKNVLKNWSWERSHSKLDKLIENI